MTERRLRYETSADTGSSYDGRLTRAHRCRHGNSEEDQRDAPCTAPIAVTMCDSVPRAIWTIVQTKTITAHLTPCGIFAKNETISIASAAASTTPPSRAWKM